MSRRRKGKAPPPQPLPIILTSPVEDDRAAFEAVARILADLLTKRRAL